MWLQRGGGALQGRQVTRRALHGAGTGPHYDRRSSRPSRRFATPVSVPAPGHRSGRPPDPEGRAIATPPPVEPDPESDDVDLSEEPHPSGDGAPSGGPDAEEVPTPVEETSEDASASDEWSAAALGLDEEAGPADADADELPGDRDVVVGSGVPPVVAVVVTRDPGPWFRDTLRGLERQDYAQLEVLVVDNGGSEDPTEVVADELPGAFVKRLESDEGFSAAANAALESVEGAPFLLFLHDDVVLGDGAVTTLVAEAFRANAGLVGPKVVDWDDRSVLRSVGLAVDNQGAVAELVDPGELDQGQHDSARAVFAVSSACMLARADLVSSLGGFSRDIPFFGEDVDLCWRAHLAGATVQFCPRAAVAHRGRFSDRRPVEDADRFRLRHQGRMVLANSSARRLLTIVPTLAVLVLVDLLGSLLTGRFRRAGDTLAAVAATAWAAPRILRARRANRRARRVPDSDFEALFHRGSYRLRSLVRRDDGENRLAAATRSSRDLVRGLTTTSSRAAAALLVAGVVFAVVGARGLVTGEVVSLRELAALGARPGDLVSQWWSGWRPTGLGEAAVAPGIVPAAGALAWLLGGASRFVARLFVLAPLLVGAIGAWKLLVRTGSMRGRSAAFVVYALNPVALNAVATGRFQALVAYAAAPWLLRRVAAHAGVEPFGDRREQRPTMVRHLAGNALLLGGVSAASPLAAVLLALSVAVLGLAAPAGRQLGGGAMAVRSLGGLLLGVPLWLPWLVGAVRDGDLASLTGVWATRAALPGTADLVTGTIGPVRPGVLGWGIVVAAAVPLLTGRSWRFGWAVGGWVLMAVSWTATVLLSRSDLVGGAGVALFLVPAALGAAVAVAMGPMAFEEDVLAGDFGLPQILSGLALVALVVGLLPVAVASSNGRWYQPEGDFARTLRTLGTPGRTRTVWLGDPDVLPVAGWTFAGGAGLSVGVTEDLEPLITQRYRLDGGAGVAELESALAAALDGRTARLGSLLAPMGVRYVLVVDRPAPQPFAGRQVPPPAGSVAALEEQLDLSRLPVSPGLSLFEVGGTWPARSDVTGLDLPRRGGPAAAAALPPASAPRPVLRRGGGTSFSGPIEAGAVVAQSVSADADWRLTTDGRTARREPLLGWAQQYRVRGGGGGRLSYATPLESRGLQAVQVVALVGLLVVVGRRRRLAAPPARRRPSAGEPIVVVAPPSDAPSEPSDPAPASRTSDDPGRTDAEERP